ncbi:MAG: peptidoglycan-binding protein [Acidiferrobacterales bacterium]
MDRYLVTSLTCLIVGAALSTVSTYGQILSIAAVDAARHVGSTATVCGKVVSGTYAIREERQPTLLDFEQPYPDQVFTVVILGSDRDKFPRPPEVVYLGQDVCVSGLIEGELGKTRMTVRRPSDIKTEAFGQVAAPVAKRGDYYERYTAAERRTLKAILTLLGYKVDFTTGEWNQEAISAVHAFQTAQQLTADGRIGPSTLRAMADVAMTKHNLTTEEKTKISHGLRALAAELETPHRRKR